MVEGGGEVDTWWRAAVRWTRGEGPAVRWWLKLGVVRLGGAVPLI